MGVHLLLLVHGNHVYPGLDDLILLRHLVAELFRLLVTGYHHQVVVARLGLVDAVVEDMALQWLVHYGERRVSGLAQRQVDRTLRPVGNLLGLGLGA